MSDVAAKSALKIDLRFIDLSKLLWRDGAYAYFWFALKDPQTGETKNITHWFPVKDWRTEPERILRDIDRYVAGNDAYFSVHPSRIRRSEHERASAKLGDIEAVNCLYADIDVGPGKALATIEKALDHIARKVPGYAPTAIVKSGGGLQCYWVFETSQAVDANNQADLEALQAAWSELVGGDPGAKDLSRVLRLPGSQNQKPQYAANGAPTVEILVFSEARLYRIDDLRALCQPILDEKKREEEEKRQAYTNGTVPRVHSQRGYTDGQFEETMLNDPEHGDTIRRLWAGDYSEYLKDGAPDQHRADLALCNHLAYYVGPDPNEIDRQFRRSRLMRDKWERADYRKATIDKALEGKTQFYDWARHFERIQRDEFINGIPIKTGNADPSAQNGIGGGMGNATQDPASTGNGSGQSTTTPPPAGAPSGGTGGAAAGGASGAAGASGSGAGARTTGKKSKSVMLIDAIDALKLDFRLNQLEDVIEVNGKPLDNVLLADLNLRLTDDGFSRVSIIDAITVVAARKTYHPIRDYLLTLQWDGQNHLGKLMAYLIGDGTTVTYGDGSQSAFHAALFGRWMTGAAARALHSDAHTPFKHQTPMLVIIGGQNMGKSSLAKWFASGVGYQYHKEGMVNPHDIEHVRSMVNKWIWEVGELASSLRRTDRDALKNFITQEYHTYRKPWDRLQVTKPTLCNFIGTLNPENGFLNDPTGHRRFLPVVLNGINHAYKDDIDINQVWAQIVSLYRAGRITPELNPAEKAVLATIHKSNEVENPLETYIRMYFDIDPGNPNMKSHTADIIQRLRDFDVTLPSDLKVAGQRISEVLIPMGLNNNDGKPFRSGGVLGRGWVGIQQNIKIPPTYNGFNHP